jgi:hypothetical protein
MKNREFYFLISSKGMDDEIDRFLVMQGVIERKQYFLSGHHLPPFLRLWINEIDGTPRLRKTSKNNDTFLVKGLKSINCRTIRAEGRSEFRTG